MIWHLIMRPEKARIDFSDYYAVIRYVFENIVSTRSSIRFSFRIYQGNKPYLGNGRIELIQLIHKYGSIAKAANAMSMSYRKAWQMVKDLNEISKQPMVEVRLGGKKGGGAFVTEEGLAAIEKFMELKSKAELFFNSELKESGF